MSAAKAAVRLEILARHASMSALKVRGALLAFVWWMIPAGLAVLGLLLAVIPARGPLWPFLLLIPVVLITVVFALIPLRADAWLTVFLEQDAVFQILLAARFVCAILMVVLARGRHLMAAALGSAALLADPVLFNYFACSFGTQLCR